MELNLTVNIDWIDEDSTLDEEVKKDVINQIVSRIQAKISTDVEEKVNNSINKTVEAKINKMTDRLFKDFLKKEVVLSDGYGDKMRVYKNVKALVKEKFDSFMTQKVDDRGRTSTSSFDTKYDRLTYIINKQLKEMADEFTTRAVKQVSEEIKQHVQDGLTNKLGSELMKILNVNKMIGIEG